MPSRTLETIDTGRSVSPSSTLSGTDSDFLACTGTVFTTDRFLLASTTQTLL